MRSTVLVLGVLLAAALPGAAAADGTVSASLDEDTFVGLELRYAGDAGRHELRLGTWYDSAGRRWMSIRDAAGPIAAGPRCVQVDPQAARCTTFGIEPDMELRTGDGDDLVRFRRSRWGWGNLNVMTGAGHDRIDARRWIDDPSPGTLWMRGQAGDDVLLSPRERMDEDPIAIGGSGDDIACGRAWEWDFDGHREDDRVYGAKERCPR